MINRNIEFGRMDLDAMTKPRKPRVVCSREKRLENEARAAERREQYRRENGRA